MSCNFLSFACGVISSDFNFCFLMDQLYSPGLGHLFPNPHQQRVELGEVFVGRLKELEEGMWGVGAVEV